MDKYEIEAEEALKKIHACPDRINFSCWSCVEFFRCPVRKDYVAKQYASMAKDNKGGFEF